MTRPSDELAAEVDHEPCPTCHAQIGEPCVNPLKQSPARVPCIRRIRAASQDPRPTETPPSFAQEPTDR